MIFDPTKPVICGQYKARIVCTDAKGKFPIVAMVQCGDGDERPWQFHLDGKSGNYSNCLSLTNIPETFERTGWVNIYRDGKGSIWATKDSADQARDICQDRIACIQVTIRGTVGDGLGEKS